MQIEFELSSADIRGFHNFHALRGKLGRKLLLIWRFIFLGLVVVVVATSVWSHPERRHDALFIMGAVAIYAPFIWLVPMLFAWFTARSLAARQIAEGRLAGRWTIAATPDGFAHTHASGSGRMSWSGIHEVVQVPDAIYVYVNPRDAYVIPQRAFSDSHSAEEFAELCTRLSAEAKASSV